MTNIQNACVLLIRELYKTEPTGGDMHIVTDDFNVEDIHLRWCMQHIGEYISKNDRVEMLEEAIIRVLGLLTEDERMEVVTKA